MLDSVPDKVLICTQALEAAAPKSVYSNQQMNTFFGCDVVRSGKRHIKLPRFGISLTESPREERKERRILKSRDKSAINRKIFSEYKLP